MKVIHKMIAAFTSAAAVSLAVFGVAAFAQDGVVNASALNVRDYPSYEGAVVGKIQNNTMVNVLSEGDGWLTIDYNGRQCYVAGEYVNLAQPDRLVLKTYFDIARFTVRRM